MDVFIVPAVIIYLPGGLMKAIINGLNMIISEKVSIKEFSLTLTQIITLNQIPMLCA